MKSASARKTVESTLKAIRKRVPAYNEIADRFGPLFLEKAKLRDDLAAAKFTVPDLDLARIAAGVPILVDADFSPWIAEMKQSANVLLPILADVLQLDEKACKALHDHLDDTENISGLARARIDGNWKHFENTSVQLGIDQSTTLLYISETVFAPVFCAMVDSLGKSLTDLAWDHGYCPVCGSTPSISHLSPREVTDLDQLVGGGGKKFLHCSLCGHDWRFKRNACAACGNDDSETREVFYLDDVKYERIEACHKCGKYCLNVDMRECEPLPHLDAIQIGLIHLDIFAHKNNLTPISPTIWNSLDEAVE